MRDLKNFESLPYIARVLGPPDTEKARQLQAELYLARGYVKISDLDQNGCLAHDPFKDHSVYFGVFDWCQPDVLLAGARLIRPTPERGLRSLQIHFDDLDAAKRDVLLNDNPRRYVEFSALVKREGSPTVTYFCLMREMFTYSLAQGIDKWLFCMNGGSNAIIGSYFGPLLETLEDETRSASFNVVCTTSLLDLGDALRRIQRPMAGGPGFLLGKNTIARFFASAAEAAEPMAD